MKTFLQDLRVALRRLKSAPAFTATAVLTLALGIGATTSIFTLVHAVLLRSLAVANPRDLYRLGKETHCCVWGGYGQYREFSIVSNDLYKYLRDNTNGFVELAASQAGGSSLFGVRRTHVLEPARSYPGEFVSGNYFKMFGLTAFAGRLITAKDDQPGAFPVAVMSYRLWQQKYGSDTSIVGTVFDINNKSYTLVGIAPPGFYGETLSDRPPDFFLPIATEPLIRGELSFLRRADTHWLNLIGRIRPGFSSARLEAQMRVELRQWLLSHWGDMDENARANLPQQTLYLSPGGAGITSMRETYKHWLQILMLVTGFSLLIICANVASLMMVRGLERRQQISVTIALGARTSRVVLEALTESLLLSFLGGLAGLIVAFAGTRLLLHFAFPTVPGFAGVPISSIPSLPVLTFAFSISLLTGVIFGLAPSWMTANINPIEALRGSNRSTARSGSLARRSLVVCQAALCLSLLFASGLLTSALNKLEKQDFGFEQDRRTIVNFDPQLAGYRAEQLTPLYRRLEESLSAVSGVAAVALCSYSPQSGDSWNDGVYVDGHSAPGPKDDNSSSFNRVTGGYFEVIGNPILRGRSISPRDTAASPHVAVVNEAFVRKFFKHEDPIGKHFGRSERGASRQYEIVGIAKDARYLTYNLDQPIAAFFFLPAAQFDVFPNAAFTQSDLISHFLHEVVILTKPGTNLSDSEVRRAISAVDPNIPVISIHSLTDQVAGQFRQQRLMARLTSFFGILSLILASLGVYGVTAFNVGRRVNEIGLRMALGASRGNVLRLIVSGSFVLILVGLLIGVPLTFLVGRWLGHQLYGINPYNPFITGLAIAALGISALLACLIPALKASLISPSDALRAD